MIRGKNHASGGPDRRVRLQSFLSLMVPIWLAATLCAASATIAVAAEDDADLPPEARAALGLFVGRWDTEAQIRKPGASTPAINLRGRGEGKWILGGRFVEFRTESVPPGQSERQIMTYDEASGTYLQWVFDSDGYRHEAVGSWDPASSTMVWRGQAEPGPFVIDDHWVRPGRLEWRMRRITPHGEIVTVIRGEVSRSD